MMKFSRGVTIPNATTTKSTTLFLPLTLILILILRTVNGFTQKTPFLRERTHAIRGGNTNNRQIQTQNYGQHYAKPKRLDDNAEGVLYVNDRCINCAACSYFAPNTFKRSSNTPHHIVYQQPLSDGDDDDTTTLSSSDVINARAALAACPVSAIRTTSKGEVSHHNKIVTKKMKEKDSKLELLTPLTPKEEEISKAYSIKTTTGFPRFLSKNIWLLGHHSPKSFGAFPYLVKGYHKQKFVSIVVDVPKFSKSAIRAVSSLLQNEQKVQTTEGTMPSSSSSPSSEKLEQPEYMFLTHVDDVGQHNDWKNEYPAMKRIFHAGDLGEHNWIGDETLEDVEILLQNEVSTISSKDKNTLTVWSLDGQIFTDVNVDDDSALLNIMESIDSDFLVLYTPGHSPGSISLLYNSRNRHEHDQNYDGGSLFTGDTLAFTTRNGGYMSGFPQYGNDLEHQAKTLEKLKHISKMYDSIIPGHGHVRDYRTQGNNINEMNSDSETLKIEDLDSAIDELLSFSAGKVSR